MYMITISLCMIVKNEEEVLARCLESAKDIADEIIVVDTGSNDKTKEIAYRYTQLVFDFEWINDFSAARNFAYSKATMDYQMWLDADDVIPTEEAEKIKELKNILDLNVDIVTMKYHTNFDSNGNPILTSTRERLTKRSKNYHWQDPVHECIPLLGNVLFSDIAIWHQKPKSAEIMTTRNLDIYEELERKGKRFTPRQLYYFARELKDHGCWAKSAYYFESFLDTQKGWFEDNIASCFNLSICYSILGEEKKILPILLRSFQFASPRAEICCQIGYYYKNLKNYQTALDWFQIAAKLDPPQSIGFILHEYWGFIPNIECCVCCCYLNQFDKANEFNRIAGQFQPDSAAVLNNEKYLASILS